MPRARPMRMREFVRWVEAGGGQVRWGKGGEIVASKGKERSVLNGRARDVGPGAVADTAKRLGLTPPTR